MKKPHSKPGDIRQSVDLRIIGGKLRGSKLRYHGDRSTRPMKDRVREAIFNLVGPAVKNCHAIDLFAGTGALGLEALSRGASSATFIEKHVPTARIVGENIAALEMEDRSELLTTSAFLWGKRDLPKLESESGRPCAAEIPACRLPLATFSRPWLTFCSPPYAFYIDRQQELLELIVSILESMPIGSIMVVEADGRFDFHLLPGELVEKKRSDGWDVRSYPPAVVGVLRT